MAKNRSRLNEVSVMTVPRKIVVDPRCGRAALEAFARAAGFDIDGDAQPMLVSLAASVMAWEEQVGNAWIGNWFGPGRVAFEDKYQPREDD